VRDSRVWSRYLTEAINLFADSADVAFASHHWPTWGRDQVLAFLSLQRDLYGYLHDQTLRPLNARVQRHRDRRADRAAARPGDRLAQPRLLRSVSHNVKAIYQRYLGWFDGNPASLWELPPAESARRSVDCIGGVDAVVAKAADYLDDGDLRFAAQLLKHAVFAMTLSNGVLVHYPNPGPGTADLAFTLTKPQLLAMLAGGDPREVEHEGDLGALQRLLSVLETPHATFAVVTP
jgi:alkyl sulfatase BDS1-like metallo-beta-lactamase superfamily hydrolase